MSGIERRYAVARFWFQAGKSADGQSLPNDMINLASHTLAPGVPLRGRLAWWPPHQQAERFSTLKLLYLY